MADRVSDPPSLPAWPPFDLFAHPVPANKGRKGRPQHAPTPENLGKIIQLYAEGRTDAEVAAALLISIDTMKRHYFASEDLRRVRRNARLFMEGELLARLNQQSLAGKTSATEKLLKRIEKAALGPAPSVAKSKKAKGLKETRIDQARHAGATDKGWGELIGPESRPLSTH